MDITKECRVITRYITGAAPSALTHSLFLKASANEPELTGSDLRLWNKSLRYPILLPLIDSAMAWRRPASEYRQRMIHRFALLESVPEYSHLFLPRNRTGGFLFAIIGRGFIAALKAITGAILLVFL